MKNNSVAPLLGYNQVFFHPDSHLFSAHFVHIWKASLVFMGKAWSFNLCMYILRTEKQGGGKLMFMPFEIVNIFVWLWYLFQKHVVLQLIHIYINSTCFMPLMSA